MSSNLRFVDDAYARETNPVRCLELACRFDRDSWAINALSSVPVALLRLYQSHNHPSCFSRETDERMRLQPLPGNILVLDFCPHDSTTFTIDVEHLFRDNQEALSALILRMVKAWFVQRNKKDYWSRNIELCNAYLPGTMIQRTVVMAALRKWLPEANVSHGTFDNILLAFGIETPHQNGEPITHALFPLRDYLLRIGVPQKNIDRLVEHVLKKKPKGTAITLAICAIHTQPHEAYSAARANALMLLKYQVLGYNSSNMRLIVTDQFAELCRVGLFRSCRPEDIHAVLTDLLAEGHADSVRGHAVLFADALQTPYSRLVAPAIALAKERGEFGTALALAERERMPLSAEQRMHLFEQALLNGKRIALEAAAVIPPVRNP